MEDIRSLVCTYLLGTKNLDSEKTWGRSRDVVIGFMEFLDSRADKNITMLSTQ